MTDVQFGLKFKSDLNVTFALRLQEHNKSYILRMEKIIINPGLQHLVEKIFWNLSHEDLEVCRLVNTSCQTILDNPLFWLKKFIQRGMSKKNENDWIEAIRITKDTDLEKYILQLLKRRSKNSRVVDLPCYINEDFLMKNDETIKKFLRHNPNILDQQGLIPIYHAATKGDVEIVKVLALLTENKFGVPSIYKATENGH